MLKFYCYKKSLLSFIFLLVSSLTVFAQTIIKGTVKDQNGNVLPGVSIRVKEAPQVGTITDLNGNYSIRYANSYKTLIASFISYKVQEVPINARFIINITLQENQTGLNEVIITGYTSTARKDLTGAVGVVNMSDLQKAPVRSFEEALAGRVAGVQVVSQDGKPGSPINILIRGISSISQSSAPLYVIDGLAIENPDNNLIDPDNIESITVLKDASSTAIYGARGSNGVIVITTKRGQTGPSRVTYSGNYGINKPYKLMKLLSPYEFVKVISEQNVVGGNPYLAGGLTLEDYRNVQGIDWQRQLIKTGAQLNQSASVSGGSAGTLYSVSGNYINQQGIIINSGYKRYQGKITLDQKVGERTKIGGFLTYTTGTISGTNPTGNANASLFYNVYTYRPVSLPGIPADAVIDNVTDPDNNYPADYRINPLSTVKNQLRNVISSNLIGNLYINYNILKNLKLTVRGSLNSNGVRQEAFNNTQTASGNIYGTAGVNGSILNTTTNIYDNTNLLEYNANINKVHRFNVLLGASIQKTIYQAYGYASQNIPVESLGLSGLDAGTLISTGAVAKVSANTLLSAFGSFNYIFNGKYYLTANLRADGSSKFPVNNRWGYFPSAAIKWKFSEEQFFKKQSVISDGNIRFSYGEAGNNRVGDFDYYSTINFNSPLYLYGGSQGNSAVTSSLANPKLKWETSISSDLGFDLSFLNNRITFSADLYNKKIKDLLYRATLPGNTGYTSTILNIASLTNRGLELTLGADVVKAKNFSYSTSFNITFNRNRLDALSNPSEEAITSSVSWEAGYVGIPAYIAKIGGPLGQIYGYISDGVYQYADFDKLPNGTYVLKKNIAANGSSLTSTTQPGTSKYIDINNDGVVNENDRTVLGNGYPLHIGGWSNNFRYKNFDANLFFQWSYGNDIINANRTYFDVGEGIEQRSNLFGGQNTFAAFANRWTPDNQNTNIPRLNGAAVNVYSSQFVEDGSYIRLKTLNVGYTFPSRMLSKYKISKLRVYIATSNLYTLTKYKGFDPEVTAFSTGLTPSLDYSTYPRPITITGGINLTL